MNNTNLVYITFSPSATYNFKKYKALNAFAGFDFEIPISARANQMRTFYNPEYIEDIYIYQYKKQNFRVGIHAGFSYDLFSANIKAFARSQISLFMLMSSGTSQIADFGSNFNSFVIKGGIVIKISPDKLEIDTHRYNPNYVEPPVALASAVVSNGVSFPGFKTGKFDSPDLAYWEKPEVKVVVPAEPEKPVEVAQVKVEQPKKQYNFNTKKIIDFPKSPTDYDLKKEDMEYLDALAAYLLANPNTRVFVEGYNDDQGGSLIENQRRSTERSLNVKRYLMNKKIPEGRIISLGRGSVNPIVPNTSKANRAKNRRVEIIIER
jgi:outer membrane protein OmpA-like peptidoglycan-associated protein